MREVRKERTGWRDEALSEWHRRLGWDCPALDLDFVLVEYDGGDARALIEYKNEHAKPQELNPSYNALIGLGDSSRIPVLMVRYSDDFQIWKVYPLNRYARIYTGKCVMYEREYAEFLYHLRGREAPEWLIEDMYNGTERRHGNDST